MLRNHLQSIEAAFVKQKDAIRAAKEAAAKDREARPKVGDKRTADVAGLAAPVRQVKLMRTMEFRMRRPELVVEGQDYAVIIKPAGWVCQTNQLQHTWADEKFERELANKGNNRIDIQQWIMRSELSRHRFNLNITTCDRSHV